MRVESYFKHLCKRFSLTGKFFLSRLFQLSTLVMVSVSAFSVSHALDPMYDYRYTFGPEIMVPDAFHVGAGGFSRWNDDFTLVSNIQVGLADEFEIGLKVLAGTNDEWILNRNMGWHNPWDVVYLIDIGGKYAISRHWSLQADIPIALNENKGWGGVLSLSRWGGYTKNVSSLLEGRLGFGGAAGEDRYVKPALAFFPYFQIGDSFRFSVGSIGSCSRKEAMLDILPRVEAGFVWFRLMGEVSVGILRWNTEKYNRFALFAARDI
jgi:hypothetical protein